MIISATILSRIGGFYQPFPCKVVEYLVAEVGPVNRTAQLFPACEDYMSGKNPDQWTVVEARLSDLDSPVPAAASLQLGFALAASIAFVIHLVGVELYVSLSLPPSSLIPIRNHLLMCFMWTIAAPHSSRGRETS